jgi:hypothetical protein
MYTAALGKSQPQIRDDILRTLSNALIAQGIPNPNVGPTSDYYGFADGVANEICVGVANGIVQTDNQMPDTSGGTYLDRWLAFFGLKRSGATQSSGVISPVFNLTTGYTNVPTGAILIDSVGLRYQVTVPGQYGPGNPVAGQPARLTVPVMSVDTGSATDHDNGDQLSWVTYVAFVGPDASVGTAGGTDGLSGGNNSEIGQDEPPRQRLFARMQNPPASGNWVDVVRWFTESSPDVQAGFCHPALLGPGTVFFCGVGAQQNAAPFTSSSMSRELTAALVTGTLVPYVQGQYPGRAAVVGASCVDQPNNVSLLMALPAAPTASPSGPGGGWLDGSPWPTSGGSFCQVTGFMQGPFTGVGSTPQNVTATGTPKINPCTVLVTITATGTASTATATVSLNGAVVASGTLPTVAGSLAAAANLTLVFPAGTYTNGDYYTSASVANSFVCNALTPPTPGVSHIAYVSVSDWTLYTATVLSFTGGAGAYTITTDTPWPNLSADNALINAGGGGYSAIFPQSTNQTNYLAAALQGFANLGPGEWAYNSQTLVRAFRHPVPSLAWPYSMDANFLRTIENSGTEVLSVQFLFKQFTTPALPNSGAPPTITATDPFLLTSAAPAIFTPRVIAFYAQ